MPRRAACLCFFVVVQTLSAGSPKDPGATFAHQAWIVTEAVLNQHIEPPARQQMLLSGVRACLARAGTKAPIDLGQRISQVTTESHFAAYLHELNLPDKAFTSSESSPLADLLASVPGEAHLVSAEELKMIQVRESNNYVGTGIQIRWEPKEKLVSVVIPFAGGPWRRAGGKPGDVILEVDGKSMVGQNLRQVVDALRGPEGSAVTASVRQNGSDVPKLLSMVRTVIPFQSVVGFRRVSEEAFDFKVETGLPFAYVHINQINSSTLHELRQLERQLRNDHFEALVLDLRNNSGGALVHAAQVADGLIDGGLLWKVRSRAGEVVEYKADRDCLFRDWPMVVLIDASTQSAAALLAATLQDRGRAQLIGAPSSSYQLRTVVSLPEDLGSLMLVTGTIERGKNGPPNATPDREVIQTVAEREAIATWRRAQDSPEPTTAAAPTDAVLNQAITLLRERMKKKTG